MYVLIKTSSRFAFPFRTVDSRGLLPSTMSDDCLIDAIPEELKHKIVDMLAVSDERFELFEQALRKRQDSRPDYLVRMDRDKSLYGKSVHHMSLVSKSWRALCLHKLFKVSSRNSAILTSG